MSKLLTVNNIRCCYDDNVIIDDLSFSVASGQIACLLGPSGCGKTTALRAIAGFVEIAAGSIDLDNNCISNAKHTVPPELRHIGMVFQDYALFPHLTVQDNVGFGLHAQSKSARQATVAQLLSLVKLEEYATYYPHQLSGGQQQRVALARALAPQPKVLLLDEPFSNLDTELRRSLSLEVRDILKQHNTSAILVTHDQGEASSMADVIGVMAHGKLQQWSQAKEVFDPTE